MQVYSYFTKGPILFFGSSACLFVGGLAIADWNRGISLSQEEMDEFYSNKTIPNQFGSTLEKYHSAASSRCLSYDFMYAERFTTLELFAAYYCAEKKKKELKDDKKYQYYSGKSLENLIPMYFYVYSQKMARRAMIRNGYMIKWLKSIVNDELVNFYVLPLLAIFGK